MYSIIFVDFNGVLSHDPLWKSLQNPNHSLYGWFSALDTVLFTTHRALVKDWMRGKYMSEYINTFVAEQLDIDYHALFQTFKEDCRDITISQHIIEKLWELKNWYYLILSTGNMDSFNRFTLPSHRYLYDVFDEIHNSYNIGMFKSENNGVYFMQVLERYEISPSQSVLIDDSESTCEVFNYLGGLSINAKTESEVLSMLDLYL